jgi:hypothetical protein
MAPTLLKSPVTVRLSLRYSNGVVESHNARALTYDESSLRVLSSREFEKGTTLSVFAPFLDGIATCWVFGITRSDELPGHFELFLQFAKKPGLVTVSPLAAQKQRSAPRSDLLQEATELLINGLYRLPPPRFSRVLQEIAPDLRPAALVSAAAAVIFLLQQKGLANLARLIGEVQEAARGAAKR